MFNYKVNMVVLKRLKADRPMNVLSDNGASTVRYLALIIFAFQFVLNTLLRFLWPFTCIFLLENSTNKPWYVQRSFGSNHNFSNTSQYRTYVELHRSISTSLYPSRHIIPLPSIKFYHTSQQVPIVLVENTIVKDIFPM